MKTEKKRLLSLLLAFCMLFSLLPTTAFATEAEGVAQAICAQLSGCVDGAHDSECPLYVAPTAEEPVSQPVCAQLAGCVDGAHDAECPLYVASPEQATAPEYSEAYLNVVALFEALPSADSITEETTAEERQAINDQAAAALDAMDALSEEEHALFTKEYPDALQAVYALQNALSDPAAPLNSSAFVLKYNGTVKNYSSSEFDTAWADAMSNLYYYDVTMELYEDVWPVDYLYIKYTNTFTLNLNGHTIHRNSSEYNNGYVIYAEDSTKVYIKNGKITGGQSTRWSGGIIMDPYGYLNLDTVEICGNKGDYGGGVYIDKYATLVMNNCKVYDNKANHGGGIYTYYADTINMTNCDIKNNIASTSNGYGGGIYTVYSNYVMTNCSITGNEAYCGGGVYSSGIFVSLKMDNCDIKHNTAAYGGGGYFALSALNNQTENVNGCYFSNCKIEYNTSSYDGGGIYAYEMLYLTLENTSVSYNSAGKRGGGIFRTENAINLIFRRTSYIIGNTATGEYGGVFAVWRDPIVRLNTTNTYLSGNIYIFNNKGANHYDDMGVNGTELIFHDIQYSSWGLDSCSIVGLCGSGMNMINAAFVNGISTETWEDAYKLLFTEMQYEFIRYDASQSEFIFAEYNSYPNAGITIDGFRSTDNKSVRMTSSWSTEDKYKANITAEFRDGVVDGSKIQPIVADNVKCAYAGSISLEGKTYYRYNLWRPDGEGARPILVEITPSTWTGVRSLTVSGGTTVEYTPGKYITITAPQVAEKRFVSWTADYEGLLNEEQKASETVSFIMPNAEVVLTPHYQDEIGLTLYSRTVDGSSTKIATLSGGGSLLPGSHTVTASAAPGYEFVGWYEVTGMENSLALYDEKATPVASLEYTIDLTKNTNLVAVYKPIGNLKLTVKGSNFKVNGTEKTGDMQDAEYPAGTVITLEYVGTNTFNNWKNNNGKVLGKNKVYTFTLVSNTTVNLSTISDPTQPTAAYALVEFISDYDQIIGADTWYTDEESHTLPTGPSKLGYAFEGWKLSGTNTAATVESIKAAIADNTAHHLVLKPLYTAVDTTYTVTVKYVGAGNKADDTHKVQQGKDLTVTAPTIEGKNFLCWALDETGTNVVSTSTGYTMQVAADTTLYAVYGEAEAEVKPSIAITSKFRTKVNGVHKVCFAATRSVPEGYKVVEQGILYANTETTMELNGAGVYRYTGGSIANTGTLTMSIKVGAGNDDMTVYARGYMIVEDPATQNREIYYSTTEQATYNSLSAQ